MFIVYALMMAHVLLAVCALRAIPVSSLTFSLVLCTASVADRREILDAITELRELSQDDDN